MKHALPTWLLCTARKVLKNMPVALHNRGPGGFSQDVFRRLVSPVFFSTAADGTVQVTHLLTL